MKKFFNGIINYFVSGFKDVCAVEEGSIVDEVRKLYKKLFNK